MLHYSIITTIIIDIMFMSKESTGYLTRVTELPNLNLVSTVQFESVEPLVIAELYYKIAAALVIVVPAGN